MKVLQSSFSFSFYFLFPLQPKPRLRKLAEIFPVPNRIIRLLGFTSYLWLILHIAHSLAHTVKDNNM